MGFVPAWLASPESSLAIFCSSSVLHSDWCIARKCHNGFYRSPYPERNLSFLPWCADHPFYVSRSSSRVSQQVTRLPAHRSLFFQGVLIQITNPKALLFVSALLPQFLDPHRSVPVQLIILVLTTVAVDFVVLSSYALMADRGVQSFPTSRWSAWLERVFGASLVLFIQPE
jgi:hypothetical protein